VGFRAVRFKEWGSPSVSVSRGPEPTPPDRGAAPRYLIRIIQNLKFPLTPFDAVYRERSRTAQGKPDP